MFHGFVSGNILFHALLTLVQAHASCPGTHVTVVGVSHLAGTVDYTAHDPYFQSLEMRSRSLHTGKGLLKVKKCTSATGARYVLGAGEAQTR